MSDAVDCEGGWKKEGKSPDDVGFTLLSTLATSGQAITTAQPRGHQPTDAFKISIPVPALLLAGA